MSYRLQDLHIDREPTPALNPPNLGIIGILACILIGVTLGILIAASLLP